MSYALISAPITVIDDTHSNFVRTFDKVEVAVSRASSVPEDEPLTDEEIFGHERLHLLDGFAALNRVLCGKAVDSWLGVEDAQCFHLAKKRAARAA